MGRPRKPKGRCLDCLVEISRRDSTRCLRCYRYNRMYNKIDPSELARKKRLKHYHMVVANDPVKLEKHREQSREGMKRVRERRKQAESTQVEDGTGLSSRVV